MHTTHKHTYIHTRVHVNYKTHTHTHTIHTPCTQYGQWEEGKRIVEKDIEQARAAAKRGEKKGGTQAEGEGDEQGKSEGRPRPLGSMFSVAPQVRCSPLILPLWTDPCLAVALFGT